MESIPTSKNHDNQITEPQETELREIELQKIAPRSKQQTQKAHNRGVQQTGGVQADGLHKEERDRDKMDRKYMRAAIHQAQRAAACGEVPIGCVIVADDKIVGRGFNQRNTKHTTLAHAELTAIDRASRKLGDWRLEGCTMYVTLEPCQMCSGAIVQSRIDRVVIGTMNPKAGCAGSILNVLQMPEFNHQVEITTGVMQEECTQLLKSFFHDLRIRNRREKMEREGTTSISDAGFS